MRSTCEILIRHRLHHRVLHKIDLLHHPRFFRKHLERLLVLASCASEWMHVVDFLASTITKITVSAAMRRITAFIIFALLTITAVGKAEEDVEISVSSDEPENAAPAEGQSDDDKDVDIDEEKLEYAKGSVCGYCEYCQFCKLCDVDCPCETSKSKPNCRMCKYCKFCYLCSAICDTVCKPGSILDKVSGAIVNALPSFNKVQVDQDIDSVKHWIDKKKDEL